MSARFLFGDLFGDLFASATKYRHTAIAERLGFGKRKRLLRLRSNESPGAWPHCVTKGRKQSIDCSVLSVQPLWVLMNTCEEFASMWRGRTRRTRRRQGGNGKGWKQRELSLSPSLSSVAAVQTHSIAYAAVEQK